jgi:hypothetical protein
MAALRYITRSAGKNIIDTNDRRTIVHATGRMEWDTQIWKRDKNWKLFRKTQYKNVTIPDGLS